MYLTATHQSPPSYISYNGKRWPVATLIARDDREKLASLGVYWHRPDTDPGPHGPWELVDGEYLADQYASAQWWVEFRGRTETEHEPITAAILGLANDALRDAQTQSLDSIESALAIVEVLQQIAPVVMVLDYPPMGDRDLPALTAGMGIDPVWWDEVFRPAYRVAMESAGAHVIGAYADWEPTNAERPGQMWPDYHLSSASAKRAATRIYQALEQVNGNQ